MALPRTHQASLTPHELEFIAEEDTIDIVPLISMAPLRLLSGIYGPFKPPIRTKVPLWMAVNLKGKRKCHIVPPDWLAVEPLQVLLATEQSLTDRWAKLPSPLFMETSKLLLDAASDNLVSASQIRSLLKDIREVRQAKLRTALIPDINVEKSGMSGEYVHLTNLTQMEINELRPFFVRAMGVLTKLEATGDERDEGGFAGRDDDDDSD